MPPQPELFISERDAVEALVAVEIGEVEWRRAGADLQQRVARSGINLRAWFVIDDCKAELILCGEHAAAAEFARKRLAKSRQCDRAVDDKRGAVLAAALQQDACAVGFGHREVGEAVAIEVAHHRLHCCERVLLCCRPQDAVGKQRLKNRRVVLARQHGDGALRSEHH